LRALVAFLIALLQLASALHFTLVPHTFSAALGGVVHVHDDSGARLQPRAMARSARSQLVPGAPACAPELCPFADAPHGSLPSVAATISGAARFGAPSLLGEADARTADTRRVFASAPKTSPPV
jgi:hypothetical protein